MYKVPKFKKSSIIRITEEKGDLLQTKIKRLLENKENLDEAPLIYTEKKMVYNPNTTSARINGKLLSMQWTN